MIDVVIDTLQGMGVDRSASQFAVLRSYVSELGFSLEAGTLHGVHEGRDHRQAVHHRVALDEDAHLIVRFTRLLYIYLCIMNKEQNRSATAFTRCHCHQEKDG